MRRPRPVPRMVGKREEAWLTWHQLGSNIHTAGYPALPGFPRKVNHENHSKAQQAMQVSNRTAARCSDSRPQTEDLKSTNCLQSCHFCMLHMLHAAVQGPGRRDEDSWALLPCKRTAWMKARKQVSQVSTGGPLPEISCRPNAREKVRLAVRPMSNIAFADACKG